MVTVLAFPPLRTAATRAEPEYVTAWSDYYRAVRSTMERDRAMQMADAHVAYLKKRDAEILDGVAKAMEA